MLVALALATALAAPSCPPGDAARTAMLPLGIQNKLLAHKIAPNDFEMVAPPEIGADIVMLRKTLDIATQAFFRCEAGNDANPASLQTRLATFLHADNSKREENSTAQDGIYGANLKIKVEPAKGLPNSVFVVLNFSINCGDDNALLLFTKEDDQWTERLHWYSNKYTKPSDAFGDIFLYKLVPSSSPSRPTIVVAHGHPWCTSVHSSFSLDLIQPRNAVSPQQVLDHITHSYVRDDELSMNLTEDWIQLRLVVESDDGDLIFHSGVLRYRIVSDKLELLPVARNAHDFVDQWLQEPWQTVEHWSDTASLEKLRQSHEMFDYSIHKEGTDVPALTFGPVRACTSSPDHFQVELDLTQGPTDKKSSLYAQIRQNPNSFTMLSISEKSDSACRGPNLMRKR